MIRDKKKKEGERFGEGKGEKRDGMRTRVFDDFAPTALKWSFCKEPILVAEKFMSFLQ